MEKPAIDHSALHDRLRQLCAQPSVSGERGALSQAAEEIATLFRQTGFQVTVVQTPGAPAIIASQDGRSKRRVLFYDHYDTPPSGSWRQWQHEPFELAEREGALYARGVVSKGNLVARLGAVWSLLAAQGELPIGVTFLIEGESLIGSPHIREVISNNAERLKANLVLGSGGIIGPDDVPFLYGGVKGRLQVQLSTSGPSLPLPPEQAAIVTNPAWRLLWAIGSIKSDAEEVLIDGFYDDVEPVPREIATLLKQIRFNEEARLAGWGIDHFLFEMTGATLVRAETINPTCNLASINAGQPGLASLPHQASAMLDFALVPNQRPARVMEQLRTHLLEREFDDIIVEQLPGAYPASRTPLAHEAIQRITASSEKIYGQQVQNIPLAPFTSPLHLFTAGMRVPALSIGLARPDSALRGPNEHILSKDLQSMAQLLARAMLDLEH